MCGNEAFIRQNTKKTEIIVHFDFVKIIKF